MWIALLFVAQVGSEWVQISQQHYRKPYRPVHKPHLIEDIDLEYEQDITPKPNRIYTNQSLNYKWKDSDLTYNKGFVTKVEPDNVHVIHGDEKKNLNKEVQSNTAKPSHFEVHSEEDEDISNMNTFKLKHHGQNEEEPIYNKRTKITNKNDQNDRDHIKEVAPKLNLKRYGPDVSGSQEDVFEESYHIIPNIGSIKRVHLDSRTVRTPILKEISKNEYRSKPIHNIKPPIGNNYNDKEIAPNRPIIIWKNNDESKKIIPGIIQKVAKDDLVQNPPKNLSRYEETSLDKKHSKNKDILMTHVVQSNNQISGETVEVNKLPNIIFEKPVFLTKEELDDESIVTVISDNPESFIEETTESIRETGGRNTEAPKPNIKHENKDTLSQDKVSTMENVLKFMRIVTDTISRNTRRSVGSKVRYLENLQDTIMANIEQRIDNIWPDDVDDKTRRKVRSTATARGGGHVEFPSSESALMTISFLTFAVYLIKLVLQVIHTYKNKAMLLTPAVVTAVGRNVAAVTYRRADFT